MNSKHYILSSILLGSLVLILSSPSAAFRKIIISEGNICSCRDSTYDLTSGKECIIEAIINSNRELKRDSFSIATMDTLIDQINRSGLDSLMIKGYGYYAERNRRRGLDKASKFADYCRGKISSSVNIIIKGYDTLRGENANSKFLLKSIIIQRTGGRPMR